MNEQEIKDLALKFQSVLLEGSYQEYQKFKQEKQQLQNQIEKLTQENNDLEERVIHQDNLIKALQDKINTYENPNDVTKMFMYTNEITQDTVNKLNELRSKE